MKICHKRSDCNYLLPGDMTHITSAWGVDTIMYAKIGEPIIRSIYYQVVLIISKHYHPVNGRKLHFFVLTDDGSLGWMSI